MVAPECQSYNQPLHGHVCYDKNCPIRIKCDHGTMPCLTDVSIHWPTGCDSQVPILPQDLGVVSVILLVC